MAGPPLGPEPVLILGAGPIGVAFAAAFAPFNPVTVVEPDPARRDTLPARLSEARTAMALAGRPTGGLVDTQAAPAFAGAALVIDCGPEHEPTKRAMLRDALARAPQATVATASSAMTISHLLPDAADQTRALVAHPVNPPSVLRLIELVPAPATLPATMDRAEALFARAGFRPIRLTREIEGFALNRLQGAVLREAYRLVDDGLLTPQDIDTVMTEGLGPRWALSGPFETADLNTTGGITAHAARMGPAYARMGAERGESPDRWPPELVARVAAARRAALPIDALPARAAWRARAVAQILALRDRLLAEAPTGADKP
ncbi:MAG: 3-hydroxyacyl-CoA dehydrogenase NAD-binding domain-containing protein [Gemmobacter sp.]